MNQRGQSSIEAVVAALALILLIQTLLVVVYCASLKMFIDYRSHESLVCATHSNSETCRRQLKSEIEKFLVVGDLELIRLTKSSQRITVQLFFKFSLLRSNFVWNFRDEITIPLKT